jgi:exosortase A-associated hydrolase 2
VAGIGVRYHPTPRGARFVASWQPPGPARATILVVPPFAEELNKSRRLLALAATALAGAGWRVCLPDLGGTGDSEGELDAARVAEWSADLATVAAACAADGAPVRGLLAVRLGAALATATLPQLPGVAALVGWQPVVSGQQHLTQFLRLRVAGNLVGGGGPGSVTVAALRAALASGETLEVAGYPLAPPLAADVDGLRFAPPETGRLPDLHWLEVSVADPPATGPLAADQVARWVARGGRATATAVAGDPFWSTVEITVVPALVEATVAAFGTPPP